MKPNPQAELAHLEQSASLERARLMARASYCLEFLTYRQLEALAKRLERNRPTLLVHNLEESDERTT
jgi:hypothetical protein